MSTYLMCVFVTGRAGWLSVWDTGLPVCGVVSELADPCPAMEGLYQAALRGALPLRLWAASLDRQFRSHMWFHLWLLPVLRFLAVHQLWPHGPVSQALSDHCLPVGVRRALFRACGAILRLPNQV